MEIEFEYEEFLEEDDKWGALFVRINGGKWHLAKSTYNTEDQEHIIELIKSNDIGG